MEEKVLVTSKRYSIRWLGILLIIVGLFALIYSMFLTGSELHDDIYDSYYKEHTTHRHSGSCDDPDVAGVAWNCEYIKYENAQDYAQSRISKETISIFTDDPRYGFPAWSWALWVFLGAVGLAVLTQYLFKGYEMTITDKRVYGTVAFGMRVDIPLDSIAAVSTTTLMRGITVASSSGKINFLLIKNVKEMYEQINCLLGKRQQNTSMLINTGADNPQSNADEIRKFKELLDAGIITQEEFDAKKKQLLGL